MSYVRTASDKERIQEDLSLIEQIGTGTPDQRNDAVLRLKQRYERLIYQKAHRTAPSETVGTDDIFAIIMKTIETWEPDKGMFSTWVGLNTFYFFSRRFQRRRTLNQREVSAISCSVDDMFGEGDDSSVNVPQDETPRHLPQQAFEEREMSARARRMLDQLPPRQRETLLQFVGGGEVSSDDLAVANATVYSLSRLTEAGII